MSEVARLNKNLNEKIRAKEVLLIDENGKSLGIVSRNEALEAAEIKKLDLFCIAPNTNPPTCKLLDYGKYLYDQKRKKKEAKQNQIKTTVKEILLTPNIDTGDLETRAKHVVSFIEKEGARVYVKMKLKGRMMTKADYAITKVNDFMERFNDIAIIEKKPALDGNMVIGILKPKVLKKRKEVSHKEDVM